MPLKMLIIGVLLISSLISCERKVSSPSNVLVISKEQQSAWIRNFNPLLPSAARWPSFGGIYEPLLVYNRISGVWQPWLAKGYEWSPDHLSLTFTLRDDVKWSDGQAFDAHDVAFTFNILKTHEALDGSGTWRYVESLELVDSHTIRFHFPQAFVPAIHYLAMQPIIPRHIWQDISDPVSFSNPDPIGTGPYTELVRFERQVFELAKNPHYWQFERLGPDRLRFPAYSSNEQANLALISGELDWAANFVPAIDRIFVQRDPEHHNYWFPLVGTMVYLYLNTTQAPYDDARVRHALSLGINRSALARIAMHNYTEAASPTGLTEAFAKWKHPDLVNDDWTSFQPDQARAILNELGFKRDRQGRLLLENGEVWQLSISVVSGWSDWIRSAQMIARDLQELGIDARVRPLDFSAWFDHLQRGRFDSAIGWSVESPSPYSYYRWLMSKATVRDAGELAAANWHRFGDSRVDELLATYERTSSEEDQLAIVHRLQELYVELKPALPLFPNPAWGIYNSRKFTGFPNKDNPYAVLSPNSEPDFILVLTGLSKRDQSEEAGL